MNFGHVGDENFLKGAGHRKTFWDQVPPALQLGLVSPNLRQVFSLCCCTRNLNISCGISFTHTTSAASNPKIVFCCITSIVKIHVDEKSLSHQYSPTLTIQTQQVVIWGARIGQLFAGLVLSSVIFCMECPYCQYFPAKVDFWNNWPLPHHRTTSIPTLIFWRIMSRQELFKRR